MHGTSPTIFNTPRTPVGTKGCAKGPLLFFSFHLCSFRRRDENTPRTEYGATWPGYTRCSFLLFYPCTASDVLQRPSSRPMQGIKYYPYIGEHGFRIFQSDGFTIRLITRLIPFGSFATTGILNNAIERFQEFPLLEIKSLRIETTPSIEI